jgi:hypothetical protein
VHLGYLRLDYSSQYFVVPLPAERQEALFEYHLRGFTYLGGSAPAEVLRQPEAGRSPDPDREKPPGSSHLGLFPATVPF